jgi:predicted RNA-binding Zn-ribbon protein involved in translation (DUF1610 family)
MNEDILRKLEARIDRRSFLRGSSLAAAALVGIAAASPIVAFAQTQDRPNDDKKKTDEKKDDDDPKAGEKAETKPYRVEGADGKLRDREGIEVRECPECGHNMYQQGRTWTCENCGYSYVE